MCALAERGDEPLAPTPRAVEDYLSPPPLTARKIIVAGTSGAGKTSMAADLAGLLGVRHVEIDGLFHGPGWKPRPGFEADVRAFSATEAWVTEWQYSAVRPLLAARADTLVWLDYPRWVVMWRVSLRTVRRRLRGEILWNGNLEAPLHTVFLNEEHIVRWAWDTHDKTRSRVSELLETGTHLHVVRLRTPRQARHWLHSLRSELLREHAAAASIGFTGAPYARNQSATVATMEQDERAQSDRDRDRLERRLEDR